MFVVDTHCDSILNLSAFKSLVNPYNTSKKAPFLQFFAVFVCEKNEEAAVQFEKAKTALAAFHAAWDGALVTGKGSLQTALGLKKSAVLTLEGADCLTDEEKLDFLFRRGVRVINPTWNFSNHLAACNLESGKASDYGFTETGRRFLDLFDEYGILPDASHLSDRAFWELYERKNTLFFASHSNCRALCPHRRNLTDDQIRALFEKGGFLGLNLYPPFLSKEKEASTEDLFRHLDHALSLGGEDKTGFGFDIDGTSGEYPKGIDLKNSIHDQVLEKMLPRYGKAITEKIAGKNAAGFLARALR